MTPAAEKDIRSALVGIRRAKNRLEMLRTGKLTKRQVRVLEWVRLGIRVAEKDALEFLGYGRAVPRRKVRLKYSSGDAKGVF